MRIELELFSKCNLPVDLGGLHPFSLLSMPAGKIEKLTIPFGNQRSTIGDHFKVRRSNGGTDEIILSGETKKILSAGSRMESGRLLIKGDAGPFTGSEMMGGELEVSGNAGH